MSALPGPGAGPRWWPVAFVFGLALILFAAFPYFERVRNANELPRLIQSMSLAESGEWAIDGPSRRGLATGPDVARSPEDGRLYPNKPPGASVVGALAFKAATLGVDPETGPSLRRFTWWARAFGGVLPVLVFAGLAWIRLAPRFGAPVAAASITAVVLGTPLFSYARLFYGHALAAALLYAGVLALERGAAARTRPGRGGVVGVAAGGWGPLVWLGFGGALAAAAITVEYGAAFAGLPIALALVWPVFAAPDGELRTRAGLGAGVALAGACVPVVMLAAYQHAVFGSALATGYHHAADPGFAALHGRGLLGLGAPRWENVRIHLLSPNTGLAVWSPLCVVGVGGLALGLRSSTPGLRSSTLRARSALRLGIFGVVLAMGLGLSFQGGWRVGPRYLVVALPMLTLGFAEALSRARNATWGPGWSLALAVGLGAIMGWSLWTNSLAATLWPHLDPTNIAEPFGAVLLPLWRIGPGPYGLPQWAEWGLHASVFAPVVLGLGVLAWSLGEPRESSAHPWWRSPRTLAVVLAGLGGLGAVSAIPRVVSAHPMSERNLRYIQRMYEPGESEAPESLLLRPLTDP